MKKINFKNSKGSNLVGILHEGKDLENILIICHGFGSNKDKPRFVGISKALEKEGIASFRFDFRDSGESDFGPIDIEEQVIDLKAAIKKVKELEYKKISLTGHSLGGLISLKVYDESIKTIILLASVTTKKEKISVESKLVSNEEFNKTGIGRFKLNNESFELTKKYITDRQNINQKELLEKIKCPVLLIHGKQDTSLPYQDSVNAMNYLSKSSKIVLLESDHRFSDKTPELKKLIISWLKELN